MDYRSSTIPSHEIPSNNPSLAEINYIAAYLDEQLHSFESLNLHNIEQADLFSVLSQARKIESAIADLLSMDGGNYSALIENINSRVYLKERLKLFLSHGLVLLNDNACEQLALKNIIGTQIHDPKYGYKQFDLDEYLIKLESTSKIAEVPISLQSPFAWNQFQKTINLLIDFLTFLVEPNQNSIDTTTNQLGRHDTQPVKFRFIFLLRDTLLLYLGARKLQSAGLSIDARGALISRALIQSFTPDSLNNPIYTKMYNQIYSCLSSYNGSYSSDYVKLYADSILRTNSESEKNLLTFIKQYLYRLCGQELGFIAIDTAAHGTIPLLSMAASNSIKDFRMYTGVPWLHNFYSGMIYHPNSLHMRMIESLVCQEELFRFAQTSNDRIIIEETCDTAIQTHAAFEIGYFLDLVNTKFLKPSP